MPTSVWWTFGFNFIHPQNKLTEFVAVDLVDLGISLRNLHDDFPILKRRPVVVVHREFIARRVGDSVSYSRGREIAKVDIRIHLPSRRANNFTPSGVSSRWQTKDMQVFDLDRDVGPVP
mmetsp:Transcript_9836/g.24513  ORF Transcript_9836/g.24513 Transcript_9836/m.24513 type:complete len:119 (+) Transcript_9836:540-896(+)